MRSAVPTQMTNTLGSKRLRNAQGRAPLGFYINRSFSPTKCAKPVIARDASLATFTVELLRRAWR